MILKDHDVEITHLDPYRHKYDSAITEYLHQLSLDSGWDESSGNVDAPTGWFARFGKRMLYEDSQGFVYSERFDTEAGAISHYDQLNTVYCEWGTDDDLALEFAAEFGPDHLGDTEDE